MATVNKNFRVKDGLIVEGAKGTIDGSDILTAAAIENGAAENQNITVTYDSNANKVVFVAENGVADSTTDDLAEGTNHLYFTAQRAIDAVGGSATSENTPNTVVKRDANGDFAAGEVTLNQLNLGNTGTQIYEGSGNLVIEGGPMDGIDMHGRNGVQISSTNGDIVLNADGSVYKGSVSPENEFTTQGRLDAYIGDVTVDSSTGNTITDRIASAASAVAGDLSTHIQDTSTHGVTGDIVGTSDVQVLTNKTINDELYFTNPSTQASDGGIKINDVSEDLEITAYTANMHLTASQDVTVTSNNGDIVLNPDGGAYISSVSAGNQIATNSYVDNAVAGLDWKQSVNLLWDTETPTFSGDYMSSPLNIDGHGNMYAPQNGYRILITKTANAGIYVYNQGPLDWTLDRAADADAFGELVGAAVFVMEGTQYGQTSWVQSNHYLTDFTGQLWTQFSGSGSVTAGTGITVDGLEVSIDRTTVDTWYEEAGAVSTHSDLTTGVHGVTGDVVGTSDSQTLSNKTFLGQTNFQSAGGAGGSNNHINVDNSTGKMTVESGYSLDLKSDGAVNIVSSANDIILNADGAAYITSATSGNEIATRSYVDNQTTSDIAEGTNLYFTDQRAYDAVNDSSTINFVEVEINSIAKQVAATVSSLGSVQATAYAFAKADYRSAKFLVKISNGTHNEISEILLTLDSSDNIAITEYAIVGTNGSRGTISAEISGANVNLIVTPVNDSTITITGTLLA